MLEQNYQAVMDKKYGVFWQRLVMSLMIPPKPIFVIVHDDFGSLVTLEASDSPDKPVRMVARVEVSPDADHGYLDFITIDERTFARSHAEVCTYHNFATLDEAQYFCLGWMLDVLGVKN